ncbi:MAG: hypothetical protein KF802_14635 [Bdellovibrionaceae bacterium]|nr:hypothetical protein [Pseudobdellovibrionaceae bacterium]
MNIERLVKLLNLTASNSDGEALNAIRLANSILRKANRTWSDLISGGVARQDSGPSIQEMLEFLQNCDLHSGTRRFIDSLEDFHSKNGFLTDRQMTKLKEIYQHYCRR